MASRFRIFTKRFFIFSNIAVVILLLLSSLAPYLNPQQWWYITFLGMGFPFLLMIVFFYLIGWLLLLKPRLALISGVAILFCFKSINVFFGFHKPANFSMTREQGTLRVVSWNVARFIELIENNNKGSGIRKKMLSQLKEQNADVLCLQEFHTATGRNYYNNIETIENELGYPYHYFVYDQDGDSLYYSSIIFSRYPIIDTGMIRYPRPTLPDVLIHADIKMGKDTVRVYTTHLQSVQLGTKDYEEISKIKKGEDNPVTSSRGILSKVKKGFSHRSIQADIIAEVMVDSPHPVILCADLNDVPNSYTYFTVRADMQDAFLKKGFGIGRTFSSLSPTLRIDYILADEHFKVLQFKRIVKRLSDHYMLVADLQIKKQ